MVSITITDRFDLDPGSARFGERHALRDARSAGPVASPATIGAGIGPDSAR
jgi:hypothetical protein